MTLDLKNLQTLLYRAITAAPGAASSCDIGILSDVIRSDGRLSALQRLGIYANAYFYRLFDCLKEDFPATAAVAGDSFEEIVRAYLGRHPPTEPSIFYAGQHLADFSPIITHKRWPFLAELARLERTLVETFHDPDAAALTASGVRAIAPADWPKLRFCIHPAVHMLDCGWRVNDVLRAIENGTQWRDPRRESFAMLVWRQGNQVYYRALEVPERAALEVASRGADFAVVCDAFASHRDSENLAVEINRMLMRWVADGLLVRVED
jgi:hypothetical protein